jgi:hypothetical protein
MTTIPDFIASSPLVWRTVASEPRSSPAGLANPAAARRQKRVKIAHVDFGHGNWIVQYAQERSSN